MKKKKIPPQKIKKQMKQLKSIEEIECKYLNKYYHFLKFAEDELLLGFKTKEKISGDWITSNI